MSLEPVPSTLRRATCGVTADAEPGPRSESWTHAVGDARRLRAIVLRVEEFVLQQVSRLEYVLGEGPWSARKACDAGPQLREWQEQQRAWEAERQRARAILQEEAARLAQAWQSLEAEQRRLLTRGGAAREKSAARSQAGGNGPVGAAAVISAAATGVEEVAVSEEPLSPERAVLQFQQMRREIQRHQRRTS